MAGSMTGRTISRARAADDALDATDPSSAPATSKGRKNSQIERSGALVPSGVLRRSILATTLISALSLVLLAPRAGATPTEPGSLQQGLEPAETCSTCHDFYSSEVDLQNGGSVEPWAWAGSMMGNSARDPVFWAGVAIAGQDRLVPEETHECIRCHAPRAFVDGNADVLSLVELSEDERAGVECDLCHRMLDDGETPAGNAHFVLDDAPVGQAIGRRGPWAYDEFGAQPQHAWVQDLEFLPSGRMCGTCHDVSTPRERVDDRGVGLGVPFNEQRTYGEWLGSVYAQDGAEQRSCIDCHMPPIDNLTLGCNMFAGAPHESGGRRHVLVGANVGAMAVNQLLYGDAGSGEVEDWRYDESIGWAQEFAATAATLDVEFPDAVDLAAGLPSLPVRVTNETGHKLPTGYAEGRVMWIEVVARYQGEVVWSSGRYDADMHTIEDDAQVRRYEAIAERWADGTQLHILLNDHWVVDNRIPPKGLVANLDTDPVGDRYVLQPDSTWPHFDEVDYAFAPTELVDATPGEADELELSVRLMYWINTPDYLEFLADENQTNDAGTHVVDAFAQVGGSVPLVLAEASAIVPLSGLDEPGETDTTDSGGGESEGGSGESGSGESSSGGADEVEGDAGIDDAQGCGCASAPAGPGGFGLLGLTLLGLVRRRR